MLLDYLKVLLFKKNQLKDKYQRTDQLHSKIRDIKIRKRTISQIQKLKDQYQDLIQLKDTTKIDKRFLREIGLC